LESLSFYLESLSIIWNHSPFIWNHSPFVWNHSPSSIITPFRIPSFSSFEPSLCHTPNRRRTLDRRKASAIILKSDRRTPDHPTNNCEQPNQLAEVIILQLLSRLSSNVPRATHVPACRSFPINCASLDRCPYQVAHSVSTFATPKRPDQGVPPFAPQPCWARLTAIVLPVQTSGLDPYP
jgi:hypothetical protein